MIVQCRDCSKEFNDKWYVINKNKTGFHESLVGHAEYHEQEKLTEKYFVRKQVK